MDIKKCTKESFSVIGKEGSTEMGKGFIQRLWEDANAHVNEVRALAKKDEKGELIGVWGAMSDFTHSFKPWQEDFTQGLYLASVEVASDAQAPEGWVKWTIPAYEYLYVKCEEPDTFAQMMSYMQENNIELVGAIHEYICVEENGQQYLFFPIRKI